MIAIILVNYNGTDDTIECLQSLTRLTTPDIRHIVVDNASRDHAALRVSRWAADRGIVADVISASAVPNRSIYSRLTIIESPKNLGFAAGNNLGIKLALATADCTHVWLLNNDTEVATDALDKMIARMQENPAIGICGSTLIYYDDRYHTQACGGMFNRILGRPQHLGAMIEIGSIPPQADIEREMDYVVGASMLVSREFIDDIGLLDERYFLYCEELDWASRAIGRYRLGWARDSYVWHKEGRSIGTSQRSRPSDVSLYYLTSSTIKYVARFHSPSLPAALLRAIFMAARYACRSDYRASQTIIAAIGDAMMRRSPRKF